MAPTAAAMMRNKDDLMVFEVTVVELQVYRLYRNVAEMS